MGQEWVFWSAGAVSAGAVEPFGCVSAGRVLAGQWSAGRPEIDTPIGFTPLKIPDQFCGWIQNDLPNRARGILIL